MKWNDRIISTCLKGRERYFSLSWDIKPVLSNMYNTNAWYLHCNSRIRKLGRCWNIRHFDWYYLLASLVKPLSPKSQQCMVLVYTPNKHLKQKNRQSKEEFFFSSSLFSLPPQMQTLAKISVELCTKILNFAQRQLESTTAPWEQICPHTPNALGLLDA